MPPEAPAAFHPVVQWRGHSVSAGSGIVPLHESINGVEWSQRSCFCAGGVNFAELDRTSFNRKILGDYEGKLRKTGKVFKNNKDLKKRWVKMCKKDVANVAQVSMGCQGAGIYPLFRGSFKNIRLEMNFWWSFLPVAFLSSTVKSGQFVDISNFFKILWLENQYPISLPPLCQSSILKNHILLPQPPPHIDVYCTINLNFKQQTVPPCT